MKSFHTLVILSIILLSTLFVSEVTGIIPSQNFTSASPTNNTYFNIAFPNFNITFAGENLTYRLELYVNGTARGTTTINDSLMSNLTTNASLVDGVNYTWYFNVSNGTQSNVSVANLVFTIDTTRPLITYDQLAIGGNHSLENNTNISQTIIQLNVNYTERNFANVTFGLQNITNGSYISMNTSFFVGSGNRSINFSALADGLYVINVTVTDLANNTNKSQPRTIRVDTTRPLVNHTTDTVGNNSNLTVLTMIMNVTVTETNFANATFILANASNGSQIFNTTTFESTARLFLNYTLNGDGNYTVNVTVTDTANNKNRTTNQFFTVDVTAPSITSSVSPSTILPVEAVTLACSVTDRMDPNVQPSLSVKKPSSSSFSSVSAGSYTDTTAEGTYTFRCSSTDYTGNSVVEDKTFSVGAGGSSGSGGGGGGGSSTPRSSAPEAEETVVEETVAEEEAPISIESSDAWNMEGSVQYTDVSSGDVYTFSFVSAESGEEEEHSVTVSRVDEEAGTVTIVIASDPQEITVAIGESKEVDIDSDGVMDLLVTLNGISDGVADVTFAKIGDWLELESLASTEVQETGRSLLWVWVLVGLIVVVIIVLVVMKMGSSKKAAPMSARRR